MTSASEALCNGLVRLHVRVDSPGGYLPGEAVCVHVLAHASRAAPPDGLAVDSARALAAPRRSRP